MHYFVIVIMAVMALAGCDSSKKRQFEVDGLTATVPVPSPKLGIKAEQRIKFYLIVTGMGCDTAVVSARLSAQGVDTPAPDAKDNDEFLGVFESLSAFPAAQESLKNVRSAERRCLENANADAAGQYASATSALETELELITSPKLKHPERSVSDIENDVQRTKEDLRKAEEAFSKSGAPGDGTAAYEAVLAALEDELIKAKQVSSK